MILFKKYLAEKIVGKKIHFVCDCLMDIDVTGTVVDYEVVSNEIIFSIDVNGKIIKLGENHPNLYAKEE